MGNTEQKTIRKAASGDRSAFRELVLEHSHAMFRVAWRLTSDKGVAEDIVQDALIKAWRKLGDFRMESSFRSWLHRITVNTAMDYLRKQAKRKKIETEEPEWESQPVDGNPIQPGDQLDIRRQTQAAMMKLSDTERSALLLRHYEGHSIKEISQMLEMTTGACKQTIFRAVKKMRRELRPLVTT